MIGGDVSLKNEKRQETRMLWLDAGAKRLACGNARRNVSRGTSGRLDLIEG